MEKELFIAPKPGDINWSFTTRRGRKVLQEQNFDAYQKASLLPSENLDPVLIRKVSRCFIRGDYDAAVFQAFKEVEVRLRKKAGYTTSEIGVTLMRKAFTTNEGPLAEKAGDPGEQQATMDLFAGAVGKFKNPSSHRDVEYSDAREVADIIHLANQLLRIVDQIS